MNIQPASWFERFVAKALGGRIYYNTGLIEDPRPTVQKKFDWNHEERTLAGTIAAAPDAGFANAKILMSPYPDEDQQGAGSCVPHGTGKGLAIERVADTGQAYARLSWSFVYRLRSNFPQVGCFLQDVMDIYKKTGAPLFTTLPDPATEDLTAELVVTAQMETEAAIYKGKNYFTLTKPNDMVQLAGIAQQGHGVPILIYATYDEWAQRYPTIKNASLRAETAEVRHCVCILPRSGFTENGKRYVAISDSAHFGGLTLRYLSEEFIAARVYGAAYWDTVGILGGGPKPHHTFTKILFQGMTGEEVRQMQLLMISLGLLPSDCATGYFGGMTLAALHAFQNMFTAQILAPLHAISPTDVFGSMSVAQANLLCSVA